MADRCGVGLGELPALRAPTPFSPSTQHSIRVAWAAADLAHAGHTWHAASELALEPRRWSADVANERGGYSLRLPDLVFWPSLDDALPVAVVVARGLANPRRELACLKGWQASITAGRYAQVRYLASATVASNLRGLARDIGLTAPQLIVGDRVVADGLPALRSVIENVDEAPVAAATARGPASDFPRPSPADIAPLRSRFDEHVETPEQAAERQQLINELLGRREPAGRRPWRFRST